LLAAAIAWAPPRLFAEAPSTDFPPELVHWKPVTDDPVFTAAGDSQWDQRIRERGWILRDPRGGYRMWYTGYNGTREGIKLLGYATSSDGLRWTRSPANPLCTRRWIEDMMVVEHDGLLYMFAEGAEANHAELLTSTDGLKWQWRGELDIRLADGKSPAERPCGTPTVWIDRGRWMLLYEFHDRGIWLAATTDPLTQPWVNVQDEPALAPGPADYDSVMIAANQVLNRDGVYYVLYHGCGASEPRVWNTCIARSTDLVHWEKYAGNPLVENRSSGIIVETSDGPRLYTMHDGVDVFLPQNSPLPSP
jgi:beta-1,2-mannobiose phosphorylase / 1,2-beta-oligomannan phosphorylase